MSLEGAYEGACGCGKSHFTVAGPALARFYCHCKICQSVYQQPYAEFAVFRRRQVSLPRLNGIDFKRFRKPPALDRGLCPSCASPVLGFFNMIPGLPLAFLPCKNLPPDMPLPEPQGHLFYHRHVEEVDDGVPKYSGYWRSEWAATKAILKGLG